MDTAVVVSVYFYVLSNKELKDDAYFAGHQVVVCK